MNLSQVFLFTCIVEGVWALSAKAKLVQFISCVHYCVIFVSVYVSALGAGVYAIVTALANNFVRDFLCSCRLAAAVGVFQFLQTTDKTASPEDSRNDNEECEILGFFDWHDLWHFLSSFALLMGAFVVIFLSTDSKNGKPAWWNGAEMNVVAPRENAAGANESVDGNVMPAVASSRRSVSQGAAKNSARENKNSAARGSERTPLGKLNKRSHSAHL